MKKQGAKIGKWVVVIIVVAVLLSRCGSNTIRPPYDSEECKEQNADDLKEAFLEKGFEDVEVVETSTTDGDLDGTVSSVSIDGDTYFTTADACESDDVVEIKKYVLETFTPTIQVITGGEVGQPEFTIMTNLPDKTKLTLTIKNDDSYSEKQELQIKDGRATSEAFKQESGYPLAGEYTVTVVMHPEDQKMGVQSTTGTSGDTMTGELIKTDSSTGNKYVYYETTYTSPYGVKELEGYIEDVENEENYQKMLDMVEANISAAADGNYTMSDDSNGVVINLWQDGLALNAAAAQNGYEQNKESWDGIVDTMKQLSASIQTNVLDAYGYSNRSVTINVLNEINMELVLLSVRSGEVIYNVADE
jgi:hypothetical protein